MSILLIFFLIIEHTKWKSSNQPINSTNPPTASIYWTHWRKVPSSTKFMIQTSPSSPLHPCWLRIIGPQFYAQRLKRPAGWASLASQNFLQWRKGRNQKQLAGTVTLQRFYYIHFRKSQKHPDRKMQTLPRNTEAQWCSWGREIKKDECHARLQKLLAHTW